MNILASPPEPECQRCGARLPDEFGIDRTFCDDCHAVMQRRQAQRRL